MSGDAPQQLVDAALHQPRPPAVPAARRAHPERLRAQVLQEGVGGRVRQALARARGAQEVLQRVGVSAMQCCSLDISNSEHGV